MGIVQNAGLVSTVTAGIGPISSSAITVGVPAIIQKNAHRVNEKKTTGEFGNESQDAALFLVWG